MFARRTNAWLAVPAAVLTTALFAMLVATTVARAQALYGSLTGSVADSSGAAAVGAQVTALAAQTGVSQTAVTDSSGIYRFTALLPGTYNVTVSAQGFSTQETPGVAVRLNEIARVDAQLEVASAQQVVTVPLRRQYSKLTKPMFIRISSRQIENLPIMGSQGGNFQKLLQTIPGAGLTDGNPQRAINTNFNGLSEQSINTRIDGVRDAYPWLPANVAYVPPADAIESFHVVTNSFDAELGAAGGAAVNVQIKTGTNHFHGDAHEFHTDQNFAARNYFQTDPKIYPKKNRNNQNQFGGDVEGTDQARQGVLQCRFRAHNAAATGGTRYPDLADSRDGHRRFHWSAGTSDHL
jgi:hypothetical protein